MYSKRRNEMKRKFTDEHLQNVQVQADYYRNVNQRDSDNLNAYIRLYLERNGLEAPAGLLPDVLRSEPEFKRLKSIFEKSWANMRSFNGANLKEFKEIHLLKKQ